MASYVGIISAVIAAVGAGVSAGVSAVSQSDASRKAKHAQEDYEFPKEQPQAPLAAQPTAPENVPGERDISQAATVKDEKRRILSALPKATKTTYAGESLVGSDAVVKKRVLGSAGTGKVTTGV